MEMISGGWRDQLGSRVELRVDEGLRISGSFHSSEEGAEAHHPLTGYVAAREAPGVGADGGEGSASLALGFVVSWRPASSITVWSGSYDAATDTISATWLLTGGPFGHPAWGSSLIGHDVFHRDESKGGSP